MQGAGPPGGHNPFAPVATGAYNPYNVNTTAQFADEVVPAVPQMPPPGASFAAGHQGAWGAPTAPGAGYAPQHVALQFTDTTAPQYVTGNIQRQEERQNLVMGQGRSDDPASSSLPGAAGAPFTQPLNPQVPGGAAPVGAGGGGGAREDQTKYPFYNVRRYREYFDVDTKDVLWRVGNSLIGVFRPNFMEVTMKNPDLYGPFWTATTLIFITAVVGNFVDYMHWRKETRSSPSPSPSPSPLASSPPPSGVVPGRHLLAAADFTDNQWFTDYTKLATSAAIFYGYIFVVGLVLFFVVKWFKGELRLVNVFCIYGYCLSIYVPVSIACMVPIDWARWVMVMTATVLSAGFLFMNFKATIYSAAPARATLVLLLIVLAHIGLGLGLKLYFFQY
ncbi:hypothetical protein PLESTB_000841300 [Pleodorina starrii]|uniref:Protein YIP n=1 Tax=Pleodorina starrii TaxID=330485 RepID=A0A9W6BM31_9CHLO|nr:hypothetical protein PLESTM_000157100 [Pleodorina starrii]GLC54265.1 hypothetical protein PLESTB_000841300 [Pleodorina starrii]GLC64434.1 hypothetical protein PLESTF_000165600 [Pleodorina starrii]